MSFAIALAAASTFVLFGPFTEMTTSEFVPGVTRRPAAIVRVVTPFRIWLSFMPLRTDARWITSASWTFWLMIDGFVPSPVTGAVPFGVNAWPR